MMHTKQKPDWMQFQTTLRYTIKDGDKVIHTDDMVIDFPPIRIVGVIECEDGPPLIHRERPACS